MKMTSRRPQVCGCVMDWGVFMLYIQCLTPCDNPTELHCFPAKRQLTQQRVQELCKAAASPEGTLEDLNLLLAAYHAACVYGQDTDDSKQVLVFKDSSTYTATMMFVLKVFGFLHLLDFVSFSEARCGKPIFVLASGIDTPVKNVFI